MVCSYNCTVKKIWFLYWLWYFIRWATFKHQLSQWKCCLEMPCCSFATNRQFIQVWLGKRSSGLRSSSDSCRYGETWCYGSSWTDSWQQSFYMCLSWSSDYSLWTWCSSPWNMAAVSQASIRSYPHQEQPGSPKSDCRTSTTTVYSGSAWAQISANWCWYDWNKKDPYAKIVGCLSSTTEWSFAHFSINFSFYYRGWDHSLVGDELLYNWGCLRHRCSS